MSSMFNLSSEMTMSNSADGNNEAYIEIYLDIFENSVAIHSIQGEAVLGDPDLRSMVKKTLENRPPSSTSSSSGFTLFGSQIKKLKHQIAFLAKRPSPAQALKRLKFCR